MQHKIIANSLCTVLRLDIFEMSSSIRWLFIDHIQTRRQERGRYGEKMKFNLKLKLKIRFWKIHDSISFLFLFSVGKALKRRASKLTFSKIVFEFPFRFRFRCLVSLVVWFSIQVFSLFCTTTISWLYHQFVRRQTFDLLPIRAMFFRFTPASNEESTKWDWKSIDRFDSVEDEKRRSLTIKLSLIKKVLLQWRMRSTRRDINSFHLRFSYSKLFKFGVTRYHSRTIFDAFKETVECNSTSIECYRSITSPNQIVFLSLVCVSHFCALFDASIKSISPKSVTTLMLSFC